MPPHDAITEAALCQAVAGDADARARLVGALAPRVRIMVVARLGVDAEELDDVCQDALLALSTGFHEIADPSVPGLYGYLSGIVRHKAADVLRSRRHERLAVGRSAPAAVESSSLRLLETLTGRGSTPSSHAARAEYLRILLEELQGLGERERQAITLAFFDHLNTTQIANAMGMMRTAAAMLLARSLQELRDRWNRRTGERSA